MCEIVYAWKKGGIDKKRDLPKLLHAFDEMCSRNPHGFGVIVNREGIFKSMDAKDCVNYIQNYEGPIWELIGHARMATSGTHNVENAHPLITANGRFIVMHNGVFTNIGDETRSDSGVFCDMLNASDGDFQKTFDKVHGYWSMFILDKNTKDLYYSRNTRGSFSVKYILSKKMVVGATKIKEVMHAMNRITYLQTFTLNIKYKMAGLKPDSLCMYQIDKGIWTPLGYITEATYSAPVIDNTATPLLTAAEVVRHGGGYRKGDYPHGYPNYGERTYGDGFD
jgi:predicted glutamine amidotransferase